MAAATAQLQRHISNENKKKLCLFLVFHVASAVFAVPLVVAVFVVLTAVVAVSDVVVAVAVFETHVFRATWSLKGVLCMCVCVCV